MPILRNLILKPYNNAVPQAPAAIRGGQERNARNLIG